MCDHWRSKPKICVDAINHNDWVDGLEKRRWERHDRRPLLGIRRYREGDVHRAFSRNGRNGEDEREEVCVVHVVSLTKGRCPNDFLCQAMLFDDVAGNGVLHNSHDDHVPRKGGVSRRRVRSRRTVANAHDAKGKAVNEKR